MKIIHKTMPPGRFKPRIEVINFSCSTQLSMKFILLINVKMPIIVGILTLISRINTASEIFKARKIYILQYFSFYEQSKVHGQLSYAFFFIVLGPGIP